MALKEDIYEARNCSLETYFKNKGFKVVKGNKDRFRISGYGGLIVFNCTYYRHSTQTSGNAIDCLVNEFGLSFNDAVEELVGRSSAVIYEKPKEKNKSGNYILPELSINQHRAFAYLMKTRRINQKLIVWLLKNKLLLQDAKYGNAIFPYYDVDKIVGAEIVGTLDNVRFKQILRFDQKQLIKDNVFIRAFACDVPDTADGYGYVVKYPDVEIIEELYLFESAIDLLSFICLHGHVVNAVYVSMGGLKQETVNRYQKTYPEALTYLCVDNDEFGDKFEKSLMADNCIFVRIWPEKKDFNEDLKLIIKS